MGKRQAICLLLAFLHSTLFTLLIPQSGRKGERGGRGICSGGGVGCGTTVFPRVHVSATESPVQQHPGGVSLKGIGS